MIKRLSIIVLSLSLCHITFSQKINKSHDDPGFQQIVFNKTVHDFGRLVQHEPAGCEFRFYNKGKSPVILSEVTASCGCTVPSWSKTPVMPGDSGIIQVIYSTETTGAIDKEISVYSNITKMPVLLKLKGRVTKK